MVEIRPTTADDLPDLGRLWNDGRVMRWVGFPEGLGHDERSLDMWFELLQASRCARHFVIHAEGRFCGELFYRVDAPHRRAELDVKLMPEAQGRGVASEGLGWLIERVFEREPDVDAVWTEPWPENDAARALYTRCRLVETRRPADMRPGPSYWERRREPV